MSTPRHDYGRYGHTTYGETPPTFVGYSAPWYISLHDENVRVDGLEVSEQPSPVVPGESRTYVCSFRPQPAGGDPDDDHLTRYRTVRDLLIKAPDVSTYSPPGGAAAYREQHGDVDGAQLVGIGPLASTSDATTDTDPGELPPARDSIHEPRWAVVTGGGTETSMGVPDESGFLFVTLETVTIAPVSTYGTRQEVRDAREHNGF